MTNKDVSKTSVCVSLSDTIHGLFWYCKKNMSPQMANKDVSKTSVCVSFILLLVLTRFSRRLLFELLIVCINIDAKFGILLGNMTSCIHGLLAIVKRTCRNKWQIKMFQKRVCVYVTLILSQILTRSSRRFF